MLFGLLLYYASLCPAPELVPCMAGVFCPRACCYLVLCYARSLSIWCWQQRQHMPGTCHASRTTHHTGGRSYPSCCDACQPGLLKCSTTRLPSHYMHTHTHTNCAQRILQCMSSGVQPSTPACVLTTTTGQVVRYTTVKRDSTRKVQPVN
jgi:hypothetical protein